MRARISPALLAMAAVAAAAGTPSGDQNVLTLKNTEPAPRRERKRQKSEKEPRHRSKLRTSLMNDPQREQAAIDKRERKNQRRFWNAVATSEGQLRAAKVLSERERRRRNRR